MTLLKPAENCLLKYQECKTYVLKDKGQKRERGSEKRSEPVCFFRRENTGSAAGTKKTDAFSGIRAMEINCFKTSGSGLSPTADRLLSERPDNPVRG